ncbi:MAG TPA: glycosyltransferase, partial [Planctomycetota bacterium]|nr:glycosyltransferase [Planctomycetota bacterium]
MNVPAPIRVVFAVHGFPPECVGGTESCVLATAKTLRALGHEVVVVAGSPSPTAPASTERGEMEGVPVYRLHRDALDVDHWSKSDDPEIEASWRRLLRELRPDVVHVHHWIRLTRRLVLAAAAEGVPAVVTLHDSGATCPRAFRVRDDASCERPVGPTSCVDCAPRLAGVSDADAVDELAAFAEDFRRELGAARTLIAPSAAHAAFLAPHLGAAAAKLRT